MDRTIGSRESPTPVRSNNDRCLQRISRHSNQNGRAQWTAPSDHGSLRLQSEATTVGVDGETIRRQYLGAGVATPDLATVKGLLLFYIATSRPQLDAERPTVDSVHIVAKWFFSGFNCVTGTVTVEEERSEVYNVSSSSLCGFDATGPEG